MTKRISIVTGAVLCLLAGYRSYSQAEIDSAYNNGYYQLRMDFFNKIPTKRRGIVFLGNSITEAGDWSDILPREKVANRGISGDISFGILARLDMVLRDKPAKIFLLIGVNDLKRAIPNEVIVKNYRKIVDRVRDLSPHTKLYMQSVLPINESVLIEPFKKVNNDNILYLNKALKGIAGENGVEYVNLWESLADDQGQLKTEFTPDGIHLKPVAYLEWVKYLKDKKYL